MDNAEVTIYCAVFNHVKYIEKALLGFLKQKTNFRYEVVVHDDHSTDGTVEILKKYQDMYPDKIKLILQEENQHSKGIKPLYAYIIPNLGSKYLAICEGDDEWIYEGKLQEQYDFMQGHHNAVMCLHNGINFEEETDTVELLVNGKSSGYLDDEDIILCTHGHYPTASAFVRAACFGHFPKACALSPVGDEPMRYSCALQGDIYYRNRVWCLRNFKHEGSWNRRMAEDKVKHGALELRFAAFIRAFDIESDHRFREQLYKRIQTSIRVYLASFSDSYDTEGNLREHLEEFDRAQEGQCVELCRDYYFTHRQLCRDYLDNMEKEISGRPIYIYGAGIEAKEKFSMLANKNKEIKGFIVTSAQDNPGRCCGKPVYGLDEMADKGICILMGLNLANRMEVWPILKERGFRFVY